MHAPSARFQVSQCLQIREEERFIENTNEWAILTMGGSMEVNENVIV
jgi:hypothetical protein